MMIMCTLTVYVKTQVPPLPPDVPFLRGVAAIRAFVWVSAASIILLLHYLLLPPLPPPPP